MGLFLDGDGRLCDRFGRSWSSQKLALDEAPGLSDLHEKADAEAVVDKRLQSFINDCEELLEKCDHAGQ